MIGTVLDERYKVLRRLGAGSMGEVYLVEHVALERREALKILKPELAVSAEFVRRFRREARAINRVRHRNIVGVHDFGRLPDGRFYLSMEYAGGEHLDEILRRVGPLSPQRVVHILSQLADAVGCAHDCGVVHRDLKPSNLMLAERPGHGEQLKILDFGIAKIIAPEYKERIKLSMDGEVFGTATYMAPEQFRGVGSDPRSDLYAVGCIGYELLTATPPFLGTFVELMSAHFTQRPYPPSARKPEAAIPPELDAVIVRLLEKEPDARFPTGRDVKVALDRIPGCQEGTTEVMSAAPASAAGVATVAGRPGMAAVVGQPAVTDPSRDETQVISRPEALRLLADALLGLTEVLLDTGHLDSQVVVEATNLQQRQADLGQVKHQIRALASRRAGVEEEAVQREDSLRFAISELRFERNRKRREGEPIGGDLDFQIGALEARLAEVEQDFKAQLTDIANRSAALAVAQTRAEAGVAEACRALERHLDPALAEMPANTTIESLLARLRSAREMMTAADEVASHRR